jgi:phospholipase D1/2
MCVDGDEPVTSFMRPAPYPLEDETITEEDQMVADPLSEQTENLLNSAARRNREIFTEVFRTVPSNLVRNFKTYDVRVLHGPSACDIGDTDFSHVIQNFVPKVKAGHVAPDISLEGIKQRLSQVRGAIVECPLVSILVHTRP